MNKVIMSRPHTNLKSASRSRPCPLCEGIDGCSIGDDGLIMCRRRQGPQVGFVCLGPAGQDPQWTLYRREGDPKLEDNDRPARVSPNGQSSTPEIDWRARADRFAQNLTPERARELASVLGLPVAVLSEMPFLGFCDNGPHKDDSGKALGPCWTFPEFNSSGNVIGLMCRYLNGEKKAWPGGKRGLSVPLRWLERDGPILIPEGPSDVLALTALGLPAVGRPSNTGGIDHLVELLRDVPVDRPIVILGERDAKDNGDWPGRDGAVRTAAELTAKLDRPVKWAFAPDNAKDVRAWVLSKQLDSASAEAWHDLGAEFLRGLKLLDAAELPPSGSGCDSATAPACRIDATNEDLAALTAQAWQAIQTANDPPTLFRYGSALSRIETADDGAPILRPMTVDRMRYRLARDAYWTKLKGNREQLVAPLLSVVRDVLATPDPQLPILSRIVGAPIFAADGSLSIVPGYDARSRTFFAPAPNFIVPAISVSPTRAEIEEARFLITVELMGDFPFVGPAEKAHAVAVTLLPFARNLIEGPTPLHSFEAPAPGTGKTLLVNLLTHLALGRPIIAMTEGRDEDEWRKRIFAKLRTAPAIVLLDNVKRRIESGALASVITSYPQWEDRILGHSETASVPVQCVWIMTGNNPCFSLEMARRTIRIRLDARVDQPWLRDTFRHPDILSWAVLNRSRLVWAALTLIQAWIVAGRPYCSRTLGMFEQWSGIMGGILDVAGISGFLANLDDFYEKSDSEGGAQRGFVRGWWEKHGKSAVTAATLWQIATESGLDLGDKGEQSQRIRLGKLLSELRDRTFTVKLADREEQLRIELGGVEHGANVWRLVSNGGGGESGESW
jgi:putative DNA primase/helicase